MDAVIRFSSLADDKNIKQRTREFESYIMPEKLTLIGGAILAFYNLRWRTPFLPINTGTHL